MWDLVPTWLAAWRSLKDCFLSLRVTAGAVAARASSTMAKGRSRRCARLLLAVLLVLGSALALCASGQGGGQRMHPYALQHTSGPEEGGRQTPACPCLLPRRSFGSTRAIRRGRAGSCRAGRRGGAHRAGSREPMHTTQCPATWLHGRLRTPSGEGGDLDLGLRPGWGGP